VSDTPETDNLARGNHVVPTEFAQDLERRLRKARDTVHRTRKQRAIARAFGEQLAIGLVTHHTSPATHR
jgi:hypothetical protein